jgi:hypothetical protein
MIIITKTDAKNTVELELSNLRNVLANYLLCYHRR